VIDGGSDDGTVKLLRQYEDEYNLQWVSESDQGQTHALNKAIQRATGEWVGWQNSDDYYLPGALNKVGETVEMNGDLDVVYGDLLIVDETGEQISRQFMTRPSAFVQRHWSLFASNQSLFARRDLLKAIHPLNEEFTLAMDAELTWELLNRADAFFHIKEPLGAFRVQEDAKTYGDVSAKQQTELDQIYTYPRYERWLPQPLLCNTAKFVKLCLLLSEGHTEAIRHNITDVLG